MQRNLGEAVRCYQQSAALGNAPAQERLRALFSSEAAGTDRGEASRSSPGAQYPEAEKGLGSAFGLCVISGSPGGQSTAFGVRKTKPEL